MKMKLNILDFIPQRSPIVMIDGALEIWDNGAITYYIVKDNHFFCRDGFLSSGGLLENIAQTAAFYAGFHFKSLGTKIPLGFISSVKALEIFELPQVPSRITTKIEKIQDVLSFSIFRGQVIKDDGSQIAVCEIRIFIENAGEDPKV